MKAKNYQFKVMLSDNGDNVLLHLGIDDIQDIYPRRGILSMLLIINGIYDSDKELARLYPVFLIKMYQLDDYGNKTRNTLHLYANTFELADTDKLAKDMDNIVKIWQINL